MIQKTWRSYWVIILLLIAPGDAEAQHKAYEPGQVWTFEADELNEHARIVIGKVEALPDLGPTAHVIIVGARVFTVTGQLGFIDLFMSFSIAALDMSVIELERTVDVLEQFDTSYQKWREVYNEGGDARQFDLPVGLVLKNLRETTKQNAQVDILD